MTRTYFYVQSTADVHQTCVTKIAILLTVQSARKQSVLSLESPCERGRTVYWEEGTNLRILLWVPLFPTNVLVFMASRGQFRVLSTLGTACRILGWFLVVVALIAAVTAAVTAGSWSEAVTGAGVFLGSLVGGVFLVAQGQLIKAVLSIERNTRP